MMCERSQDFYSLLLVKGYFVIVEVHVESQESFVYPVVRHETNRYLPNSPANHRETFGFSDKGEKMRKKKEKPEVIIATIYLLLSRITDNKYIQVFIESQRDKEVITLLLQCA